MLAITALSATDTEGIAAYADILPQLCTTSATCGY